MIRTERDRIMQLEEMVLDLQQRLRRAEENADMRKIYLDQMTKRCDELQGDIERLELSFVSLEDKCALWQRIARKLFNPFTHMEGVEMFKEVASDD